MAWITTQERTTYDWHGVPSDDVPSDREMKSVLVSRLNENPYTQDAQIRVDVEARTVVLLGAVETPDAKHAADDDAWAVPGVVEVDNRLQVAA